MAQVFLLLGFDSNQVNDLALTFVNESIVGLTIVGMLDTVMILLLIFFIVTRLEKQVFSWSSCGLEPNFRNLLFFGAGLILGIILYFGSIVLSWIYDPNQFTFEITQNLPIDIAVLMLIWAFLNSFWQEISFRGYLQNRAVDNYGPLLGILIVSILFVILHAIDRPLTPITIIVGILLFSFVGLLYHVTRSLYLVMAVHATLNLLPMMLDFWPQDLASGIIYGFVLILSILVTKLGSSGLVKEQGRET